MPTPPVNCIDPAAALDDVVAVTADQRVGTRAAEKVEVPIGLLRTVEHQLVACRQMGAIDGQRRAARDILVVGGQRVAVRGGELDRSRR